MNEDDAPEPDWEELQRLSAEIWELHDRGELTREAYDRLWTRAEKAVRGHTEFLEGIFLQGMLAGVVTPEIE